MPSDASAGSHTTKKIDSDDDVIFIKSEPVRNPSRGSRRVKPNEMPPYALHANTFPYRQVSQQDQATIATFGNVGPAYNNGFAFAPYAAPVHYGPGDIFIPRNGFGGNSGSMLPIPWSLDATSGAAMNGGSLGVQTPAQTNYFMEPSLQTYGPQAQGFVAGQPTQLAPNFDTTYNLPNFTFSPQGFVDSTAAQQHTGGDLNATLSGPAEEGLEHQDDNNLDPYFSYNAYANAG